MPILAMKRCTKLLLAVAGWSGAIDPINHTKAMEIMNHPGTHEIGFNSKGALAFAQLAAEQKRVGAGAGVKGHTVLFNVRFNFDLEEMDTSKGVTMVFDKQNHDLRLDNSISTVGTIAWGAYSDTIGSNGWSELTISASDSLEHSNDVRMYSAGYIEGILTCVRISQHYSNLFKMVKMADAGSHAVNGMKAELINEIGFMRANANLVEHIMTEEPADIYFRHSRYILFQIWGLVDGYNFVAKHFNVHSMDMIDFMLLNSMAELPAYMKMYAPQAVADRLSLAQLAPLSFLQKGRGKNASSRPMGGLDPAKVGLDPSKMGLSAGKNLSARLGDISDAGWERRLAQDGHCSALIRVTQNNGDLLAGHSTWGDYSTMLRIYKYYNIPLPGAETYAYHIGMSSYPGAISSPDSMYVMDSGLLVMDTSMEIMDLFIWEKSKGFSDGYAHLPNFAHILITNRLARSGVHWSRMIDRINTGTYNVQWMVLDYKQFHPGEPIRDNTLWLVETLPGLVHKEDVTHFLRDFGYWPSMNRPYFDVMREASGQKAAQRGGGIIFSWFDNPRARIFKAVKDGVNSLFDMRGVMNRNLYPFEIGGIMEPGHAIMARNDLAGQAIPNGGLDAKMTSRCLMKALQIQGESGPTHAAQPAFQWVDGSGREKFPMWPHKGQPNVWNFGYVQITPGGIGPIEDKTQC